MSDPKKANGDQKLPMQLLPPVALRELAKALGHGAERYGSWNWRATAVEIQTYVGAIHRHLSAFTSGEDLDPDSGASHLAHIMASCAILLDAGSVGKLEDNRPGKTTEYFKGALPFGPWKTDSTPLSLGEVRLSNSTVTSFPAKVAQTAGRAAMTAERVAEAAEHASWAYDKPTVLPPAQEMIRAVLPAGTLAHVNGKTMRLLKEVPAEHMELH